MQKAGFVDNHTKTGGEQLEFTNKAEGVHTIDPDCSVVQKFEELKLRRRHRYVIFKIGDFDITVEKIGARNETYEDFKNALPFTDSRYAVFDQEYKTHDGRATSKIWFVSWFPNNSTPYNKMAYTSAKARFRDIIPGVFDVQASNVDELDGYLAPEQEEEDDGNDSDF